MAGAWAHLVNSDGSDEHLALCNEALLEVQLETQRRLTESKLAALEGLRVERGRPHDRPSAVVAARQLGELNGLDMAIRVLKGEL